MRVAVYIFILQDDRQATAVENMQLRIVMEGRESGYTESLQVVVGVHGVSGKDVIRRAGDLVAQRFVSSVKLDVNGSLHCTGFTELKPRRGHVAVPKVHVRKL